MAYILRDIFIYGFPTMVPAILLLFVLFFNANSTDRTVKFLKITLVVLIFLSIVDSIEGYYADDTIFTTFQFPRLFCSVLGYIIRPIIPCLLLGILIENRKRYLYFWIPIIICVIVYQFAFYTDWVFGFDAENHYFDKPLKYAQVVACIFYGVCIVLQSIRKISKKHFKEGVVIIVCCLACILGGICQMKSELFDARVSGLLNVSYVIAIYIYFIFLHLNSSKRDILTGLYNRETYYSDMEKYKKRLSAIIALDMNGLKQINDFEGHLEGDKAIYTIAKVMEDAALKNMHCYRVGGDEFIVICVSTSEDLVIDYIADVKKRLTETRYTCSIGYSYTSNNTTILEMKRIADEKMYSDKSRHYESLREKN